MSTESAASRLEVLKTYKLYINGAFPRSESGQAIPVRGAHGRIAAHVSQGSRKDLRDAVEAALAAQPRWSAATAYNRGQVMHRMAEMLEGRRDEFIDLLRQIRAARQPTTAGREKRAARTSSRSKARTGRPKQPLADPGREVDAAVDRLVCFAGWADKFSQVLGCHNPVAGPYYNFTVPEPTGVVGIVPPDGSGREHQPVLLAMISLVAPVVCAGNAAVVIADGDAMLPAAVLGEVCATSDLPAGVVNIITGRHDDLAGHLADHRAVNAISAANVSPDLAARLKAGTAENLKRIAVQKLSAAQWFDSARCEGPWSIEPFVDYKTIWHPSAV